MKVKVKESGKMVELVMMDPRSQVNCASDFIGNAGGLSTGEFVLDEENRCYVASEGVVDWWRDVIVVHEWINYLYYTVATSDIPDLVKQEVVDLLDDMGSDDLDMWSMAQVTTSVYDVLNDHGWAMMIFRDGSICFAKKE